MEVIINYNGQALSVEVTVEVYEYLDRADHKTENLAHEQRRHWDGREFDETTIFISSHILSEVDLIAGTIGIIQHGNLWQNCPLRKSISIKRSISVYKLMM